MIIDPYIRQILRNQAALASALSTLLLEGARTDEALDSLSKLAQAMKETGRFPEVCEPK